MFCRGGGTIGPLLPFTATSRCCGAVRQSGYSCITQHFQLKLRHRDKSAGRNEVENEVRSAKAVIRLDD